MEEKNIIITGGTSLSKLLTVAFVILKLTGHITWSWVWVLSPLWIVLALGLALFILAIIIATIAGVIGGIWGGYR